MRVSALALLLHSFLLGLSLRPGDVSVQLGRPGPGEAELFGTSALALPAESAVSASSAQPAQLLESSLQHFASISTETAAVPLLVGKVAEEVVPTAGAVLRPCYIRQEGKDGVGHQFFGMLSVMGAHGVASEETCYVYDTRMRTNFSAEHVSGKVRQETLAFLSGFYQDFVSSVGSRGCASAELVENRPKFTNRVQGQRWGLRCSENTSTLDQLWYGLGRQPRGGHAKQCFNATPFMQAVVRNATRIAALAVGRLPPPAVKPVLAVHLRFGDHKATSKKSVSRASDAMRERFVAGEFVEPSPAGAHVFSDDIVKARQYLKNTFLRDATFHGQDDATVLEAMSMMVAARAFVGSLSSLPSSVAMMRMGLGLGKNTTYMPDTWQWADPLREHHTMYSTDPHETPAKR